MLVETAVEAARRFGDRPALVTEAGWSLSYRELDRYSDEAAVGLARRGVRAGDVVSLVLPACPDHIVLYLAIAKLGAITAAVNPKLAPVERLAVLERAGPALVMATAALAPEGSGRDVIEVVEADGPERVLNNLRVADESPPPLESDPDRPIAIVFTSGTTGTPKGAVFCGRQTAFITSVDVGEAWGGGGPTITGSALAHLGPTTKLAGSLRRGNTQYLTRTWHAAEMLRRTAALKISYLGGVPTQVALMLQDPDFERYDLSAVQAIIMGGGPATPALVREARLRFGSPLAVRYSCTEAGIGTGTAFSDPEEDAEISVGRPQPGVRVRVIDEEGRDVETGSTGEVCLDSPAMMAGYWGDPEATATAFAPGGGVRTGDLGYLDEAGRLRLAGRARERYVRGGYNVYPVEVEGVLADHPAVGAVCVVPKPDEVMGEIGVAVVVSAPGTQMPTVDELRSFAGERLARYKLPEAVMSVGALPLTPGEKIDRRALERMVAEPS